MCRVLFLCTGNSCRSQMAEGWLRHLAGDHFEVVSAGTDPKGVNPLAIETMEEIGIDISDQHSTHVGEFVHQSFDYVITVCDQAKEQCPHFPNNETQLHWSFDDPASVSGSTKERQMVFRRIRDEIGACMKKFLRELS